MASTTASAQAQPQARRKWCDILKISLPVSRVRKLLDPMNINKSIVAALTEIHELQQKDVSAKPSALSAETRALAAQGAALCSVRLDKYNAKVNLLKASKKASDKKALAKMVPPASPVEGLEGMAECVGKLKCRFSHDSSCLLASALDYVVQQMVRAAMVNANSVGKAIIKVEHVDTGDFPSSPVYSLVSKLPVFNPPAEPVPEEKQNGSGVFESYITNICRTIKEELTQKDEKYASIRISRDIRRFCSDVVVQLIDRLAPLIKLYADTAKIKTVNDEVMLFVFKFLMTDSGADPTGLLTFVSACLERCREDRGKVDA